MSTGMGTGTLSEKRTNSSGSMGGNPSQTTPEGGSSSGGGMGDADIAGIIGASAGGLDSITNMVGMFTGKPAATETNYTTPPPEKKKVSPFVWIGGGVLVLLLIVLLISSKNGQATSPQT
jgi:hypothetical protein